MNRVSVLSTVQVGVTTAEALLAAVDTNGVNNHTSVLRAAMLQLLQAHAQSVQPEGEEHELLDLYRDWLTTATRYFSGDPEVTLRVYSHASGSLSVELQLALAVQAASQVSVLESMS